jgi:hypothetical protein
MLRATTCLLLQLRSNVPATLAPDEFLIPAGELSACGLPKPSILKLTKLVALHRQLVIKRVGALPSTTLAEVITQLRRLF